MEVQWNDSWLDAAVDGYRLLRRHRLRILLQQQQQQQSIIIWIVLGRKQKEILKEWKKKREIGQACEMETKNA